jgi:hypothetical protein
MTASKEPRSEKQSPLPASLPAVILGSAAVLILLVGVLLTACGSNTSDQPSQKVQTMLQERWKAMNVGDTAAVAKAYATNAVLDNYADAGRNVQGSTAIADYFAAILKDFRMQWIADGDPIQYDKYVIQRIKNTQLNGPGTGAGIHVMEVDGNAQIVHEWITGWASES